MSNCTNAAYRSISILAGLMLLLSAPVARAEHWKDKCTSYSDGVSDAQFAAYAKVFARRDHRLWHFFWHAVRNTWHQWEPQIRQVLRDADPRLEPPRLLEAPQGEAADDPRFDPLQNNAGEDFLYMHRVMIEHMQSLLLAEGLPCIRPWASMPTSADDPIWPVDKPRNGARSDMNFAVMSSWQTGLRDTQFLKLASLGTVGHLIEVTLHNNLHSRWAKATPPPVGQRPLFPQFFLTGKFPDDWAYDDPPYDFLGDTYSSHVNRVFWKLHGWVDETLDLWLEVHGHKEIAVDCGTPPRDGCYQWKGTWLGPTPGDFGKEPLLVAFAEHLQRFKQLDPDTQQLVQLSSQVERAVGTFAKKPVLSGKPFSGEVMVGITAFQKSGEDLNRTLETKLPEAARGVVPPEVIARILRGFEANSKMDAELLTPEALRELTRAGAPPVPAPGAPELQAVTPAEGLPLAEFARRLGQPKPVD